MFFLMFFSLTNEQLSLKLVVSEELEYIIRLANAGAIFGYLTLGYLEIKRLEVAEEMACCTQAKRKSL